MFHSTCIHISEYKLSTGLLSGAEQ